MQLSKQWCSPVSVSVWGKLLWGHVAELSECVTLALGFPRHASF